ncbi:MAG TPA: BrnT family toxin [Longimicrobium sp.]|nr:BrnT family toxin [Longimicrobium sp.]HSU13434.1 BrnT family toxin [Longimicrobium sp.]
MTFEWDPEKAQENLAKHGVSFEEATSVFGDPLSRVIDDPDHSTYEIRLLLFGRSNAGRLLTVCFTETADAMQIITARKLTRREAREYENSL